MLKNGYSSNIIKFYDVLEVAIAYQSFVKNGNFNLTRAPRLATVGTCAAACSEPSHHDSPCSGLPASRLTNTTARTALAAS
jgi:hypothetical protein